MSDYYLKLGFKSPADKHFVPFVKGVIDSISGNPNFPKSVELVKPLKKAYDEYVEAIPTPNHRSPALAAIKNEKRALVVPLLKTVGYHVQMVAGGNRAILESSGFEVAGANVAPPIHELPLAAIQKLNSNGIPQMLIVKCQPTPGAKLYDVRISTDQQDWKYFKTENNATIKVENLPVDTVLYVQARMRNKMYTTPWTSPVMTRIYSQVVPPAFAE